ncbi:hypothetical protein MY520_25645, partial [Geodermatophilus sp. CPCC 205506]
MTSPVMPAAPAVAPATPASTGPAAGGEQFATALDDAVADGQGRTGRSPAGESEAPDETAPDAAPATDDVPPEDATVTAAGMPAGLWLLLHGAAATPTAPTAATTPAAAGTPAVEGAPVAAAVVPAPVATAPVAAAGV